MGATESVPETTIHEFTVKVRRSPIPRSRSLLRARPALYFHYLLLIITGFCKKKNWGDFFEEQDCNGKEVSLETYKGKVLLVVNVASKWYAIFP